ncbi:MAG: hypothetical protein GYB66_06225 [Chloroflexi bacterium]|nr:hypothetical protein [Chloroflexota bacterium]
MPEFTSDQLDHLSNLIAERTGLNTFGRSRNRLMEFVRFNPQAYRAPAEYISALKNVDERERIWQDLLSELTVGETYFMRDADQINALRQEVLPALIQLKRQQQDLTLRLWSAGCATGEEAYSLAMLIDELLPNHARWDVQVLATDVNDVALDVARVARYRDWSFRNTSPQLRDQHFKPVQAQDRQEQPVLFEIRPHLRKLVRFQHSNLLNCHHEPQDLIICRNVLIYFTRPGAEIAETRLAHSLKPDGWLFLSAVESLRHTRPMFRFQRINDTIVYRKRRVHGGATTDQNALRHPVSWSPEKPRDEQHAVSAYQQAVWTFQRGQLEAARGLLQPLLETAKQRNRAPVYSLMAAVLIGLGQQAEAHEFLHAATEADMLYPDAHYLMALVHLQANDWQAARSSLRASIYCRPNFALAHLLSGDLFALEGQSQRAQRAWQTAHRLARALPPDVGLSDVADVTAGQLVSLVDHRLE